MPSWRSRYRAETVDEVAAEAGAAVLAMPVSASSAVVTAAARAVPVAKIKVVPPRWVMGDGYCSQAMPSLSRSRVVFSL